MESQGSESQKKHGSFARCLALPHSDSLTIVKLTSWLFGTRPSTLGRPRQSGETQSTKTALEFVCKGADHTRRMR